MVAVAVVNSDNGNCIGNDDNVVDDDSDNDVVVADGSLLGAGSLITNSVISLRFKIKK